MRLGTLPPRLRLHRLGAPAAALVAAVVSGPALPSSAGWGAAFAQSDSAPAAVRRLLEAQQAAWNEGDLDGFMAGYWESPDLLFTSGGLVQRGWRRVLERYKTTYGTGARMGRLAFSGLEVHPLGPDAAWALGRWELDVAGRRAGGVFTLVLRRVEGEWRIVHDHTSSGPAPEQTEGAAP